jgi:uncharacterized protein YfdQ (DUF2303 family)
MEQETTGGGVQAAIDAGMALADVRDVEGTPVVVLPRGASVQDLSHYLPEPTRKVASVTLHDVASFVGFVLDQKTDETRLYGQYTPPSFRAVFNDHGAAAGWRDYVASYACPLSVEWTTWKSKSGAQMNQEQFAQFIEDNLPDVAIPTAAEMLEISRSLEAKKKVNFASGIRLSNGQNELTYEEEITGTAQKGKLKVPEEFTIGIPVLEGGEKYAVVCRLRYRIGDGGKLAMWYELVRPHKILEDAVHAVWVRIQNETALTIFNGKP